MWAGGGANPTAGGFECAVPIEEALRLADHPIPERNQVAPQPVHSGRVRGAAWQRVIPAPCRGGSMISSTSIETSS